MDLSWYSSLSVRRCWPGIIPGIPRMTGEVFQKHFRKKSVRAMQSLLFPRYMAVPLDYYYSSAKGNTREYGATTAADLENISSESGNSTMYYVVTGDISAADPNGDALLCGSRIIPG